VPQRQERAEAAGTIEQVLNVDDRVGGGADAAVPLCHVVFHEFSRPASEATGDVGDCAPSTALLSGTKPAAPK
jgi:hypothetical protein